MTNHYTREHQTPSFQFDGMAVDSNNIIQLEDSLPILTNDDLIAGLGIDTKPLKTQTDLVDEDAMELEVTFDDDPTTGRTIEFSNY